MPRKASQVEVRVFSEPRMREPTMVCGLPGSGFVGKLGADHLVSLFKAERVAEYRCDSFPPLVNVAQDGTAERSKAELFHARAGGRDLLIVTADAQPGTSEGEYRLSEEILSFARRHGVKTVYALAAYITGAFPSAPKVYGSASSKGLLDRLAACGVTLMKDGGISGMNGLMVGMATLAGLEGACILGETSGYVIDAAASEAVLEALSRVTGIAIDTRELRAKAAETKKLISQLQAMQEQAREAAEAPRRERRPEYIS